MKTLRLGLAAILLFLFASAAGRAAVPEPVSGDYALRDFRFGTGETLPEVKIHYRTLGTPRRNAKGVVENAVLILHGTTGSGKQFFTENFAGVLFGPGQLLDASKYYLIVPDGIGHGESSRPSDGLRMRFPRYTYDDMVAAQYRLLTEGLKVDHLRLVRWAACTRGSGARNTPTSWTASCRSPRCRARCPDGIARGAA